VAISQVKIPLTLPDRSGQAPFAKGRKTREFPLSLVS
jgi:hypothetical protein